MLSITILTLSLVGLLVDAFSDDDDPPPQSLEMVKTSKEPAGLTQSAAPPERMF